MPEWQACNAPGCGTQTMVGRRLLVWYCHVHSATTTERTPYTRKDRRAKLRQKAMGLRTPVDLDRSERARNRERDAEGRFV